MDIERARLVRPYSFLETASMSSRSDSLNSIVIPGRGGPINRGISNGWYNNRNSHQNKRSNKRGNISRDCGQYQEHNNKDQRQFQDNNSRGHTQFRGNSRDHGQILDNSNRDHGLNQNRVRQNSNTSSSSYSSQIYNTECKYYVCPGCKLPYNYFKNRNILSGRLPKILECEHTICEDCINKSMKTTNHVCCPRCLENTKNKKQTFDYNHFIVGHITCSRMNQNASVDFSNVGLVSTGVKLQGSSSDKVIKQSFEEKCGLGGCGNSGTVCCFDCFGIYCNKCDEALHNSGKHLMSHKRNDIKKDTYELNKCPEHSMMEELYCANCEENCCCYCILEKHEGHKRNYLARLDEAEEVELKNAYMRATKRLQELQVSQKRIDKPDADKVCDLEIEIARCFSDIHAKLYLLEKKLREKAKQESNNRSTMSEVNNIIGLNIETIKYLLECVDHRSEMKLNLRALLHKLKEMEEIPSFIISDAGDETESKLVVDEKFKQIESYFKLEIPSMKSYKLVTANELPEGYKNEDGIPLQEGEVKNVENHKVSSQNKASTSRTKPVKLTKLKRSRNEFEPQSVYITHMHSLNCFYVQFKKEDEQFRELMREIKNHVEKIPSGVPKVDINELYMSPCLTNKNEWGRVRVLEEVDIAGNIKYKVKFIDFGNGTIVDKCDLKCISSSLANKKPFAVECRLDNISENPWAKNSHLQLANLLDGNKEVIMFTKEFSNNIYTVDLNISTSGGDLCSVTDLLVFGCDALQGNSQTALHSEPVTPDLKLNQIFDNSDKFVKGESCEIYLRYVSDPWNVYIQKASYENSLTNLISSMEKYYNKSECDIHLPVRDSDVVIFFPSADYGNWHRARIHEVFNNKKVVCVFLVDWGKEVNVIWKDLRKLVELFRTTESLVIKAKLADVGPTSGNGWSYSNSSGAKEFLEKYSIKHKLKMLVSENAPLEIVLFETHQTYDDNINALIVKHEFACSTGKLSETVKWLHKSKDEEKLDENEYLSIYKNYMDDDDSEEELQGVKSQVEIVRFNDPHSIYISFVSMKPEAQKLHEELQIHYKQVYDIQENWTMNDKIVVFDPLEKSYYRGRIQMIENEQYYVYLLDRAEQICVTQRELRSISTYFSTNFPNMVFKCHLANIKPAGDSNKWSFMSIEWFQKLFDKHKDIYVKKVSDDQTRSSIPVTMWYSKIKQGTALEPSFRKFISIDKKVVKAGLAFRVISDERQEHISERKKHKLGTSASSTKTSDCVGENEDNNYLQNPLEYPTTSEEATAIPQIDVEEDTIIDCEIKDWLAPLPIKKKEFFAYVTCAETEGYLFVRDQDLQPLYKDMEDNMKKHFDSIPKAKPFELHQNQLVTIWSSDFWYRGVILSVIDKTTAKVMQVDFGSDHIVNVNNLHNKIMYPEVPIMVTKIKLYDVHSKTPMWSESDVETLLSTVSEYSRIVIQGNLKATIPLADVYDSNGVCLNDKIVKFCPNLYRKKTNVEKKKNLKSSSDDEQDDTNIAGNMFGGNSPARSVAWSSIVEEEDEEMRRTAKDYNYIKLMPGEKVLVDITSVWDYRTLSIYVGNSQSKEEEFASLSATLQEEAPHLESLEYFEVDMPCISLFQDDNQWYRAKIFQIDQHHCGYVTVIYVDYGNFEIVKLSDLKPVKPEWLNFPAPFHVARLNYRVVEKENECYLLKHLQELVGKSKSIEIVQNQPLSIHIYEEETDEFYYEIFVKNGVVELDK